MGFRVLDLLKAVVSLGLGLRLRLGSAIRISITLGLGFDQFPALPRNPESHGPLIRTLKATITNRIVFVRTHPSWL